VVGVLGNQKSTELLDFQRDHLPCSEKLFPKKQEDHYSENCIQNLSHSLESSKVVYNNHQSCTELFPRKNAKSVNLIRNKELKQK